MHGRLELVKAMCRAGNCFHKAQIVLSATKDLSLLFPIAVNHAFAMEMYLKALFYYDNGEHFKVKNRHTHDIKKLYDSLSDARKKEIEDAYYMGLKEASMEKRIQAAEKISGVSIDRDLNNNLFAWSRLTTQARYYYENMDPSTNNLLSDAFEVAVVDILKRLVPDLSSGSNI